jgi:hypothetical protein
MSMRRVGSGVRVATVLHALRSSFKVAVSVFALSLAALASAIAHEGPPRGVAEAVSIEELKFAYLSCNRAAMDGHLDKATIMQCSVVYEELKRRAFGGDFEKLLAWSRREGTVLDTGR